MPTSTSRGDARDGHAFGQRLGLRASPLHAALGGVAAGVVAGATMALLRWTLQVRSVPERLLESTLLLVSPDLLETSLQRFGFEAKHYALALAVAATLGIAAALGTFVLARGWSGRALLALGPGLWLSAMLGLMPLTGAGWFATELIDGTWTAILGYLAVALAYAGTLAGFRLVAQALGASPVTADPNQVRRAALLGGAGALAALISTYAVERAGVRQGLSEVRVLDPPDPHLSQAQPGTGASASASGAPGPTVQATADPPTTPETAFPQPRPLRPMKRDKGGAVLAAGRRAGELTDFITSNDDFYVVTKNSVADPVVDARTWRLRVDGDVDHPVELDYTSLRRLPAIEVTKTVECISNLAAKCDLAPFGCDLISTARWKGVRLSSLLELAGGAAPTATSVAVIGADEYTSALPLSVALDPDTLLVYEMNGEVLPREHGYPARLLVPGRYGMKNPKWVIGLRPMTREFLDWYGQRSWSTDAVVKTMSRIDLPSRSADLAPGEYNIAGIAYGGDRGISRVEFSVDNGLSWQTAEFVEPPVASDAWVRWIGRFTAKPDEVLPVVARATDGAGDVQVEEFSLPQPDGSSGWPSFDIQGRRR